MSTSYDSKDLTFKQPVQDKSKILKSCSAFISDAAHITSLGTDKVDYKKRSFATLSAYGTHDLSKLMKEDGYSRSGPHTILTSGYNKEQALQALPFENLEKIKKSDPTRFTNMLDPQGRESTSR
jgi:hypothetical protein